MALSDEQLRVIQDELFAGRKIQAIKFYREQTASDLLVARRMVEAIEAELRHTSPDRFAPRHPLATGVGKPWLLPLIAIAVMAAGVIGFNYLSGQKPAATTRPTAIPGS